MATMFEEVANTDPGAPTNTPSDSFLEKYVGEGKKYKDVEELAKAYDNANAFIPTLKADMEALKEFTLEQLASRANASNPNQPDPPLNPNERDGSHPNPANPAPPKEREEVDLNERIKQALEERDTEKRLKENAKITEEAMLKHYGSKEAAVEAIRVKAEELNVSPQWLADSAFQSPKAFFGVMGISEETPRSTSTPNASSDVNPRTIEQKFGGPKPNTYAWYDNIRRTDPKRYRSPELQQALMADAMRLGNDFFKR